MGSLVNTLISLAAAGTMLLSAPLDQAAPQHDVEGTLFLVNRQWRVSQYYVPEHMRQAQVTGQVRTMREEAAAALEEMYAACTEEAGVTLTSVSGYRSYSKQNTIYQNKVRSVGSKAKADEYVARGQRTSAGPGYGRGAEKQGEPDRFLRQHQGRQVGAGKLLALRIYPAL